MLAEAGATVPEIAAVTGHSLKHVTSILETYLSRTRHLADSAIIKLEKHAIGRNRPPKICDETSYVQSSSPGGSGVRQGHTASQVIKLLKHYMEGVSVKESASGGSR